MAVNLKRFIKEPPGDEHIKLFECRREELGEGTSLVATMHAKGGMTLNMTTWGESVEEHYGDFDIECFRHYDKENLTKFKLLLEKKGNVGFCNRLKKEFFTNDSYADIDKFCEENAISFTSCIY